MSILNSDDLKKESEYDLVVVGSGFASSFFIEEYARKRPKDKICVLERGNYYSHSWRLKNEKSIDKKNSTFNPDIHYSDSYVNNNIPNKDWRFSLAFGGSSNCWTGHTPRFLPNDFKIKTLYNVDRDWPISYEDLEPYYCQVEKKWGVSGHQSETPYPMSTPYPYQANNVSQIDKYLKKKFPKYFYPIPVARPNSAHGKQSACCHTHVCELCPINSKATVDNCFDELYKNPNIDLFTNSKVEDVIIEAGTAKAVRVKGELNTKVVKGSLIALGANAIFNAELLLKSGFDNPMIGKGLNEQIGYAISVDFGKTVKILTVNGAGGSHSYIE